MDRSEPTLIPEWLKNSGSVTSNGYVNHKSAFCLHSVDHPISKNARNKSSANGREHGLSRSVFSDRTTSSYFRRSTNTKDSARLRSYSSFRSNRDRSWDEFNEYTDKNKSVLGDQRHREYSDNPSGAVSRNSGKDTLRRSQSLIVRNLDATSSRKVNGDSSEMSKNNHIINKTLLLASGSVQCSMQTAFGRDFPSLGTENKLGSSELRRVPSPGLGAAVPTFSSSSSSMIGVDGWTSSLAEVPGLIGSTGSAQNLLSPQAGGASGISAPLSQRANGLNMAEAVAQGPSRARTPPQASVDTQRLEELAIKQSRQLIPVIPSIPKASSLGPLEKLKPKTVQQQAQLLSPNQGNHNVRSGPTRLDAGKTSNMGKLQFLKPSRELSSVSINAKECSLSPKNGVKVVHSGQIPSSAAAAAAAAPNRSPVKTQNLGERKQPSTNPEKKPLLQQAAQSRNDFFKLLKKKSSATTNPSSIPDKSNGEAHVAHASCLDSSATNNCGKIVMTNNGEGCCKEDTHVFVLNGEEEAVDADVPYPDEEEAAFLRSLGWEECAGEDEGLTEDEIKAFYEYMKLKPTSEAKGFQQQQLKVNNGRCVGST